LVLADIPKLNLRLECWLLKLDLPQRLGNVNKKLEVVQRACKDLKSNRKLKEVLDIIITFGNYMNGGNKDRGQADGFEIELLPKLNDTKNSSNTMTLLQYVAKVAAARIPEANKLSEELKSVFEVGVLADMVKESNELASAFKECKRNAQLVILNPCGSPSEDLFEAKMSSFFDEYESQVDELVKVTDKTVRTYVKLVLFFSVGGEDGDIKELVPKFPEFMGIFKTFIQQFMNALPVEKKAAPQPPGRKHNIGQKLVPGGEDALNAIINQMRSGGVQLKPVKK